MAAEKALSDALVEEARMEYSDFQDFLGLYSVRYKIETYKLVSIIIPTKDLGETLINA